MKHKISQIENITLYGKIALATISLERVAEKIKNENKTYESISNLIVELWNWQNSEKVASNLILTEEEAQQLPSFKLYEKYSEQLLTIYKNNKENLVVRSANVLHGFCCWLIEAMEGFLNSNKPYVFDSDIIEANYSWLIEGMELGANSTENPQYEFLWQQNAIEKLQKYHTIQGENYHGTAIDKTFFDDLD